MNDKPKPGTIGREWVLVFNTNEIANKSGRHTDAQIQAFMRKQFPGRTSREFMYVEAVQNVRARFNRGFYGPIKKQSHQYDSNGNVIYPRGRPANKRKAK